MVKETIERKSFQAHGSSGGRVHHDWKPSSKKQAWGQEQETEASYPYDKQETEQTGHTFTEPVLSDMLSPAKVTSKLS